MIKFTKMHGLGNDYVYIDCIKMDNKQIDYLSKQTTTISDRHFGVGSDGVILICKSNKADFKMLMFNSDGSQSEMCGNGIRCVGKYVYDKKLTNKQELSIETLAGIKKIKLYTKNEKVEKVTVNMGKPVFKPKEIPVISNESIVKNLKLKALDREFVFTCISMGNPHAITVVKNLDEFDVQKYGKILETNEHFTKRSNIEFVEIIDRKTIKMRVWERGAGETLACGTGASATCVACTLNNLVNEKENITVQLLGGNLHIKWDGDVYMTGDAVTVFEGQFL